MKLKYYFEGSRFEFEAEPKDEDYAGYLISACVKKPKGMSLSKESEWHKEVLDALTAVIHCSDDFREILDGENDFIEYLKKVHEDEALEEYYQLLADNR